MRRLFSASLLTLSLTVPAFAQSGESITIEVTNLDVVVTDSRGNHVHGLTKDDFEVLENGKPREVTNFAEAVRAESGSTATPAATTTAAPRRILLVFDNTNLPMGSRRKVVEGARKVLASAAPSDKVMIATLTRSLVPRLQWTNDAKEIDRVLEEIAKDATLPVSGLNASRKMIETVLNDARTAIALGDQTKMKPPTFDELMNRARRQGILAQHEVRASLAALNGAMTLFPRGPARKALIIAGGGLPLRPESEMWELLQEVKEDAERGGDSRILTGSKPHQPLMEAMQFDTADDARAFAAAAYARGVAVYALNPEFGHVGAEKTQQKKLSNQSAEFASMSGGHDGYALIARLTGGSIQLGRPAADAIEAVRSDLDSYYSIGFRAAEKIDPRKQANVVVKVKNGHRTRMTLSGGPMTREWEIAERVMANIGGTPATNDLRIKLRVDPPVVNGEERRVPMKVLIPVSGLKLARDGANYTGGFLVFVSMGDKSGGVSEPHKQSHDIRWTPEVWAQMQDKVIGFQVDVVLEPGRDQISVGVMDLLSDATGYDRWTL